MPLPPPPVLSPRDALFLDFDGTLVEIADRPDAVVVDARLPALLRSLERCLDGALALVSGRAIGAIDRHLGIMLDTVAGLHGAELRIVGGEIDTLAVFNGMAAEAQAAEAQAALAALAAEWPGVLIEDKGAAIAVHYRAVPAAAAAATELIDRLSAQSLGQMAALHGKMVAELKPAAIDKGSTVETLMLRQAFAGRRPVFVGDDATDEHGFDAVNAAGGVSIVVGERRPTAAGFALPGVADLIAWLSAFAASAEDRSPREASCTT